MRQLRLDPTAAEPLDRAARGEPTKRSNSSSGQSVTVLGEYVSRHRGAASMRALVRTREGDDDVPSAGHGVRGADLPPRQNRLLAALDANTYADLLAHLERVALPQHWVVSEAGRSLEHVYFPISGIVSFAYESANGNSVEVALAGNDGVVGVHVFMGGGMSTSRAVVRNSGHGYRIRADVLKAKFDSCPALRQVLLRYVQALIVQTTQTAVCHCQHRLEQQLARLLLSTLDRLGSNELALTQDAMANLLGVRRESITAVAGKLQTAGLIQCHRGRITVPSRPRLDAFACECNAVVRAEFDRLFPRYDAFAHRATSVSHRFGDVADLSAAVPLAGVPKRAHPVCPVYGRA